jgi:hypothetical protein
MIGGVNDVFKLIFDLGQQRLKLLQVWQYLNQWAIGDVGVTVAGGGC